jgi:hypothetical protein
VVTEYSMDRQTQATDENSILLYDQQIWSSTKKYIIGDTFSYSTISSASFKRDRSYIILSLGNTNWNLVAGTTEINYAVGDTIISKNTAIGTGIAHDLYNDEATTYTVIKLIPTELLINPTPPNSEYYRNDSAAEKQYVGVNAATMLQTADGKGYDGYLTEDGIPPNGAPFTAGIAFPINPVEGQFALRKDYLPHRLFRFNGSRWVKFEDNVRMTMNNLGSENVGEGDLFEGKEIRQTQKTTFINNTTTNQIDGHTVKEKQGLSKALRPQADE